MKENRRHCLKCGASPSDNPNTVLHRFPKPGKTNILRCESWAKFCFPHGSWQSLEFQTKLYSEHRMLCTKHFKSSWFIDAAGTKLFKSATPDHECDKMLSNPNEVPDAARSSHLDEPRAGPSQPLLENMNLINLDQNIKLTHQVIINKDGEILEKLKPEDPNKIVVEHKQKEPSNKRQRFFKECTKHLKKVYRLEQRIKKMKNKSRLTEIIKNDSVSALFKAKISPTTALLLQGELKNYKKASKARRWDTDSKIVALRWYKRSPTCYKLLRRMMCLPAPSTLKSLLNKFKLSVGINQQILDILKKKISEAEDPSKNEYVLMWDEMSIKKNLQYNPKEDVIEGFQDHADQGRSPAIASYALVFMVAGIRRKVKQPIAYYLSAGSVTADRLTVLIKQVLQSCIDAGLNISATVCDMDGVNKRSLSILGATVEQPVITVGVGSKEIVTLFDTPHLLKCFRNLFLKHDIQCQTDITSENKSGIGIAKWAYIKEFYDLDNSNPNFVFAPILKKEHLDPNTKQKMKVKLAAQVLSHSVAAGMYAKISKGLLSAEAVTTANVVSNMDKLFDSVNASTPDLRRGKPLSTNLRKSTQHLALFAKMKEFFKNLKFLGARSAPPSQEGWVWTLNGLERVWKNLTFKHKCIKSLATRRLQQDPLENLFGCIRGNCGANTNPTAGQFVAGLKTAVLSNLAHIGGGNCENDENDVIISNYKSLFAPITDVYNDNCRDMDLEKEINYAYEESTSENDVCEIEACAYVCGFVIKNNSTIKSCECCKKIFVSETQLAEHSFIDFKEYDTKKKTLMYATKEFIMCMEESATIINKYLENEAYKKNLKKNATRILHNSIHYNFLDSCAAHKRSNIMYIINSVLLICIKRYCTLKNRQFTEEYSRHSLKRKIDILQHK